MNNVERLKNYQNRNAATIEALYRAVLQDRARRENSHETAWFNYPTKARTQKAEKPDSKARNLKFVRFANWPLRQSVIRCKHNTKLSKWQLTTKE